MEVLDFIGDLSFVSAFGKYDSDLGCTDYMEKNYQLWFYYPDCRAEGARIDDVLVAIYEKKSDAGESLPRYVIDLKFGDGDTLCFKNSAEVVQYLCSIMPMIEYHEKWNKMQDEENGN